MQPKRSEICVHIIIPCYNMEMYVEKCVRSIQQGTWQNFHIVCVNDGSTDNTLSVLNNLAAEDKRIAVIDKVNGGVSSARNAGLREIAQFKDDYVSFIDPDDFVYPQYLEILCGMAEKYAVDYVRGGIFWGTQRDHKMEFFSSENITERTEYIQTEKLLGEYLVERFQPVVLGVLFRVGAISDFFDETMAILEDLVFTIHFFEKMKSAKIVSNSLPTYYHYAREDSLSHSINPDREKCFEKLCIHHMDVLNNENALVAVRQRAFLLIAGWALDKRSKSIFLPVSEQEKEKSIARRYIAELSVFMRIIPIKHRIRFCLFFFIPLSHYFYLILSDKNYRNRFMTLRKHKERKSAMKYLQYALEKVSAIVKYIIFIPQKIYIKLMRRFFVRRFFHFGTNSGIGNAGYGDTCTLDGHRAISIGNCTWFGKSSEVLAYCGKNYAGEPMLKIGDGVFCTSRCRITCAKDITIEDNVLIAPDVFITDHNHGMKPENPGGYLRQPIITKPVHIKEGVWLGHRVCVMPGVTIGAHSIIGANSVVTRDIPDYCIAVGSPALVVKRYNFKTKQWEKILND